MLFHFSEIHVSIESGRKATKQSVRPTAKYFSHFYTTIKPKSLS